MKMSIEYAINYWTVVALVVVGVVSPRCAFSGMLFGMVAWWFLQGPGI